MRRTIITLAGLALVAVAAPGATPAQAAGAEHVIVPEEYDEVEHFDAGEGFCVDWAGSFHEVRHGAYRLLTAPGGQVTGERHVNGVIEGLVELIPTTRACRRTPAATARRSPVSSPTRARTGRSCASGSTASRAL